MAGLLATLVAASERAARVARVCRSQWPPGQQLVAEKPGSARFARDFKTVADVLIQELVRHHLTQQFPQLEGHIQGEESNEFCTQEGVMVTLRVGATVAETAAGLLALLAPERETAELLAQEVHRDLELGDSGVAQVALDIDPQDLAVWIDPIDSTHEYIEGREEVPPVGGIAPGGLCTALVLIGVYERHSGCPVLGVINEPFHRRDPNTGSWQGRYHWGIAYGTTRLSSMSPPPPSPPPHPCVVLSRAERGAVRGALEPLCGSRLRVAAGAGYKMLSVMLGGADAFVLSDGTSFAWDTCAPHAILRALGGGVVALREALRARRVGDAGPPPELVYNCPVEGAEGPQRWANKGGLVAYVHPQSLEAVLGALEGVPGL